MKGSVWVPKACETGVLPAVSPRAHDDGMRVRATSPRPQTSPCEPGTHITIRTRSDGTTYRSVRKGHPAFGTVCACGGHKAKQAFTCQACHSRVRGYGTVPTAEQNRRARMRYFGQIDSVGDEDEGKIFLADQLERARAAVTGELAQIVAEQAEDDRIGHLARGRWMVSLDGVDQFGRPLYEVTS